MGNSVSGLEVKNDGVEYCYDCSMHRIVYRLNINGKPFPIYVDSTESKDDAIKKMKLEVKRITKKLLLDMAKLEINMEEEYFSD
jgi:hypothetical protein